MNQQILIGRARQITSIPRQHWEEQLSKVPESMKIRLSFMTREHHLVRHFVVRELPRTGKPIPPEHISQKLKLPLARVNAILDELEAKLFFLVRDKRGRVSWAFPVTVDKTPHRLTFSTGESIYAAWAEDAFAAPFVEGRLRKKRLSVEISTECAHCPKAMRFMVGSDLKHRVVDGPANPLLFEPEINWATFADPNIIHAYWRNSVFFWSEEHAREFRASKKQVDGVFLRLQQVAYSTRIAQGALFAF